MIPSSVVFGVLEIPGRLWHGNAHQDLSHITCSCPQQRPRLHLRRSWDSGDLSLPSVQLPVSVWHQKCEQWHLLQGNELVGVEETPAMASSAWQPLVAGPEKSKAPAELLLSFDSQGQQI